MVFLGRYDRWGRSGQQLPRAGQPEHVLERESGPRAPGEVPPHREDPADVEAAAPREVAPALVRHTREDPVRGRCHPGGVGAELGRPPGGQPLRCVWLVPRRKVDGVQELGGGVPHPPERPCGAVPDIPPLVYDAIHSSHHADVPRQRLGKVVHCGRLVYRHCRVLLLCEQHHLRHDAVERPHSQPYLPEVPPAEIPQGEPYLQRALCPDHPVHRAGGGFAPAADNPGQSYPPRAAFGPADHISAAGGLFALPQCPPSLQAVRQDQQAWHQPDLLPGSYEALPLQGRHGL
mmetsp:Transcript_52471/g.156552  ORF Transcript_52471/g.156552 Transcript_52471/m.156552 type:complete len:290 (-) Transcript_52471:481-1350(-)